MPCQHHLWSFSKGHRPLGSRHQELFAPLSGPSYTVRSSLYKISPYHRILPVGVWRSFDLHHHCTIFCQPQRCCELGSPPHPTSLGVSRQSVRFHPLVLSFASEPSPSFWVKNVTTLPRTLSVTSPPQSTQTTSTLLLLPRFFMTLAGPTLVAFILASGTHSPDPDLDTSLTIPSPWQGWPVSFLLHVLIQVCLSALSAHFGVTQSLLAFPHILSVPFVMAPTPRIIIGPWRNAVRALLSEPSCPPYR